MAEERFVIIVAGGKGLRMGGDVPKQFQPIGGRPVLVRTLENFHSWDSDAHMILVLPESQIDYWNELCRAHSVSVPHVVCAGGATRFDSVKNGLSCISANSGRVAVHDGVRPFVSHEVISRCFDALDSAEAVVPAVAPVESVRQIGSDGVSRAVIRDDYRLVQTPQTFRLDVLRKAYEQPYQERFTDDASVVESIGCTIKLVEGNRENIKLTTPFDLTVAQSILKQ